MWGHYLLAFYRSMTRHRLYAALNVFGLAVGIAVFLVLWLDVRFQTSFERWIPDARSIYLVRSIWHGEYSAYGAHDASMGATLDELQGDYPQLVGTRIWYQSATVRQGAQATSELVDVVDPSFFKVFDLPLAAGDKAGLLGAPDEVVLTQEKAKTYFGATNPIGKHLTLVFLGAPHSYRVSGVLKDLPRNTDQKFDFLVPLTPQMVADQPVWRHWGLEMVATYLRFERPAEANALNANLESFVDRHGSHDLTPPPPHRQMTLRADPLVSLHLSDPKDAMVVGALGAVGLLTLLLAGVNYVNLATARAGMRAREVALRKVMGATARSLVGQFMGEALGTALLAALIGLGLCELALPLINATGGLQLRIDYLHADSIFIPVVMLVIVVGLSAGVYPALVLSRFQPAGVLASARSPGGGRAGSRVREALVLIQFAIAIAFTIATGVIVSQTNYLRHADLGYKRDGLILVTNVSVSEVTGAQRAALLDAWRSLPGVVSVTSGDFGPGATGYNRSENVKRPGVAGEGPALAFVTTNRDFFQTYGARLKAGRFLDRNYGSDDPPQPLVPPAITSASPSLASAGPVPVRNIVINSYAAQTLGFRTASEAIGKSVVMKKDEGGLTPLNIVGVIDNIRFQSPHTILPPTIYYLRTADFEEAVAGIRYAGADPRMVMSRVKQEWGRIVPSVPFRARTAEESLQRYYRADDQNGRLFSLGAVLAVAIGSVGLYGLASFTTARRVREIGLRKTLGASTSDILRLLIGQFLRPVLLANLIAWPLAWLAMRNWLSSFDQTIKLGPAYFLAATALTLLIAMATVAGQAFAVARSEPAKALRHE
jgi:putative ABC transport system permease protein